MVYVTHEQAEAMALADRVAVMNAGRIEQVDTPQRLYREPGTEMVAGFVGTGVMVDAVILRSVGQRRVLADLLGQPAVLHAPADRAAEGAARVCLRVEDLAVTTDRELGAPCRVSAVTFRGRRPCWRSARKPARRCR